MSINILRHEYFSWVIGKRLSYSSKSELQKIEQSCHLLLFFWAMIRNANMAIAHDMMTLVQWLPYHSKTIALISCLKFDYTVIRSTNLSTIQKINHAEIKGISESVYANFWRGIKKNKKKTSRNFAKSGKKMDAITLTG